MAKQQAKLPRIQLQGVTNYDKLRNLKKHDFNTFNPFLDNTFSQKAKKNHEAESLDLRYLDEDIYNQMLSFNLSNNQNRRFGGNLSYYNMTRKQKRIQLQRLSIYDQIDEVLTKLCDEIVVQDDIVNPISLQINKAVLEESKLREGVINEVVSYAESEFKRICKMMGIFQEGSETSIWNKLYCFLVEGDQAYEFVWDDLMNPKKIIAIHEIDALETEPFYVNGIQYWKHHKRLSRKEESIIMYDTQVAYVSWSTSSPNSRVSYVEQLLKTFNDLRIIDESTVVWTLTNSVYRMVFKVPTRHKSRTQALQTLATEKNRYHDDVSYDSFTGQVNVNGRSNLQMMKEYWFAEGDAGSPEVSSIGGDGPDLTNMDRNEYFLRRFYKSARMPYSRFDDSGSTWNIDTRSQLREEINLGRLSTRIRSIYGQIYKKALYLSLVARFPELRGDDAILDSLKIKWNSYNVFEELMHLDVLNEKIEAISKINEAFVLQTPDGDDMKFFALDFLIQKYLPELTETDLKLNDKLMAKQTEKMFKHQISLYTLKAVYDPDRHLDPETGLPDMDAIAKLAKDHLQSKVLKTSVDNAEDEQQQNKKQSEVASEKAIKPQDSATSESN